MKAINTLILFALLTSGLGFSSDSPAQEPILFSQAELDQMLAPIALYPDTVLSHVLIAATYPLEIVQAARWSRSNPGLSGEAAVAAVETMDWDASVKALVAFPELITRMDEDLDWTQRLGDAFLAQEAAVVSTIQNLRAQAYAQGNLQSNEHVQVVRETEYIYIEPAQPRVVYVPYYDPWVVYGSWWWPAYPPVYWHHPPGFSLHLGFFWGVGYHVAPAFYFSSFYWPHHSVVVVDHHDRHHDRYDDDGWHDRDYESGRDLARHDGARRWQHDPAHRRGVGYRREVADDRVVGTSGTVIPSALPGRTARLRDSQRDWATEKRSELAMNTIATRPRGDLLNGYGRSRQRDPERAANAERTPTSPLASRRSPERNADAPGFRVPMPNRRTHLAEPAGSDANDSRTAPRSVAGLNRRQGSGERQPVTEPDRVADARAARLPGFEPRQRASRPAEFSARPAPAAPRQPGLNRSGPEPRPMTSTTPRPQPAHRAEPRRSWTERAAPAPVQRQQASPPTHRAEPRGAWTERAAPAPIQRQQASPPTHRAEPRGAWTERAAPAPVQRQQPSLPTHRAEPRSAWTERAAPAQRSMPSQRAERAQSSEPAPRSQPERRSESAERSEPRARADRFGGERERSRN